MVWDFIGCKVISMIFPFSHVILGVWQKVRLSEMLNNTNTTIVSIHWIIFVLPFSFIFSSFVIESSFDFASFLLFFATFESTVYSQFTKFTQVQVFSVSFRIQKIQRKNGCANFTCGTLHSVAMFFRNILFNFDGNEIRLIDRKTKNDKEDGTETRERGNGWLMMYFSDHIGKYSVTR